jgi:hypothetical protein
VAAQADSEDVLPPDAFVIRGGRAVRTGRARLNALSVYEKTGIWGLCGASRPFLTADALAQAWTYTGEWYSTSTVQAIRNLGSGFDVIPDSGDVHAIIVLPREPYRDHAVDPMWADLQKAFIGTPTPNPKYTDRGR